MYPHFYHKLLPHWLRRAVGFLTGVVLLYAPFALLTRLVLWTTGSPLTADVHRICMRMPIQWLAQPWMYGTIISQPAYLGSVLVLPAMSLVFGPLFCGWMCPAGQLTEFLSRIVPPRFQLDLSGKVNGPAVRYGFALGMMGVAFIGGNVCCSFCNFAHTQAIISAIFGRPLEISYWASFTVVSFGLWFVVLGMFTRGGRGWCNLLCPAGALMGATHALGRWLRLGRSMKIDPGYCRSCGVCASVCPAWAIGQKEEQARINLHACNTCMDCKNACPHGAITYSRNRRDRGDAGALRPYKGGRRG